ncbi:serpentine type 7TM GPCR receptor class ab chemoreceptor domain-containing protein [Ditylenchus destructor]|nr:serpentine type 7TM GPCR receptor class ab chemoreceptor domain-containing protein [Ditylenchus destructor]
MEVISHNWTETCDAGGPLESNVALRFCHFGEIILNLGSLFLIFTHVPWKRLKERKLPPIHVNFTWPVIILWNIYIVYDDDPIAYKPYCLQTSPMNAAKMSQMLMILLIVDIVTTVGDVSLRIVNRIQRKRKNVDYSLPKSYQIAENASATKVIVTLSLVHSLTFTSYLILTNVVRICLAKADLGTYISAIEGVHLIISFYILATLCMASHLKRSLRQQTTVKITALREQGDVYFAQFSQQLSGRHR